MGRARGRRGWGGGALLAAGDEETLWVVRPVVLDPTGRKIAAYELLGADERYGGLDGDTGCGGNEYFSDQPRGLAVWWSPGVGEKGHAGVRVLWIAGGGAGVFVDGGERGGGAVAAGA